MLEDIFKNENSNVLICVVAVVLIALLFMKSKKKEEFLAQFQPPTGWYHQGCWKDTSNRAIPTYTRNVESIQECINDAKSRGMNVAGLQANGQCFVGKDSDYRKYGKSSDTCNLLGGNWQNNVYIDPSDWAHKGCWKDTGNRAIPEQIPGTHTVDGCIAQAINKGYNTAGLQYNGQCFVGNNSDYKKYGSKPENCSRTFLGGAWQNNVFINPIIDKPKEDTSMKCIGDPVKVYRYTGGKKRHYPNPTIASSWDPNWGNSDNYDCNFIQDGPPMEMNLPKEGASIKCNGDPIKVYRYTEGKRRHYPNPVIAGSWDPNWGNTKNWNCAVIPEGPPMAMKEASKPAPGKFMYGPWVAGGNKAYLPLNINTEGGKTRYLAFDDKYTKMIDSQGNAKYYEGPISQYEAGNWDSYKSAGKNYKLRNCPISPDCAKGCDETGDCGNINPTRPPGPAPVEGAPIKCYGDNIKVFRYTEGKRRHYPNPAIASSWDEDWGSTVKNVGCNKIPEGPPMEMKEAPKPKVETAPNIPLPDDYSACGQDGDVCDYIGENDIYYGVQGKGLSKVPSRNVLPGKFKCLPIEFGNKLEYPAVLPVQDPLPGVKKSCYLSGGP
jgi:WSC domain